MLSYRSDHQVYVAPDHVVGQGLVKAQKEA